MNKWFWLTILTVALAAGTLSATGQDAKELAAKGHITFLEVLGGHQAKWAEAVKYMEEARGLDPKNANNLYNLSRAYFYDALTHNKPESIAKSEETLNALLLVNPKETRALSFHGSLLTSKSQGKDIAMFMKGAQEMMAAVADDPENINNRIVIALTSRNFPPQALAAMNNYDNLKDLEIVRDAFAGQKFYYAPHAQVVMNTLVGDAYKSRGNEAKAKAAFDAALAQPKPADKGALAGRAILDQAIMARMNGPQKAALGGVFNGCHSCHLNAPDKISKQ
jgi:tetratricopeptide (TPR) repeat protein